MKLEIQKAENGGYMIRNPRTRRFVVLEETDDAQEDARSLGIAVMKIVENVGDDYEEVEESAASQGGSRKAVEDEDGDAAVENFLEQKAAETAIEFGQALFGQLRRLSRKPKKGKVVTVEGRDPDPSAEE